MRVWIAGGFAVAAVALCACGKGSASSGSASATPGAAPSPPSAASADLTPHRRPGLWRQVIVMDGQAPQGPGMRVCVDAASDAGMSLAGAQSMGKTKCPAPQFTRNLDGSLNFSSTCGVAGHGVVTSSGVVKGDFNTSYTTVIHVVYAGLPVASMNGPHTMTITGTWQGPCAPGEKGGDVILPNGAILNAPDRSAAPSAGGN
jgi:hypothetical protein